MKKNISTENDLANLKIQIGYDDEEAAEARLAQQMNPNSAQVLLQKQKMLKREIKTMQDNLATMFDGRLAALEQMQEQRAQGYH